MTLSVRRSIAALAVGAALVTAGCGDAGPDRAAIVDGTVISETDVQSAMTEINGMDPALLQQALTPTGTLTALVQAPLVIAFLEDKGVVVSQSVATQTARDRGVADPSDSTLSIIKLASGITAAQESGQLTEADAQILTEQLQTLDIEVNPRYGVYSSDTGSIQLVTPEWVKAVDAAP